VSVNKENERKKETGVNNVREEKKKTDEKLNRAMKHDVYVTDEDVLTENIETPKNIPADENSIHNIDPLIQPLIDTDELEVRTENNNQKFNILEKKPSSPTSLHSHEQNSTSPFSRTIRRCTGIFYALIGSLLFTCSGFIIKQLRVDFFDALLCRFIIQTCILTIFVVYKRYKIIDGTFNLILLQIIRVILASCGFLFFYLSYRYIPLPDLTTFRYTQVIWTAILAMIIFRERISIPTIFAIILTLIGVVCVAQPTFLFSNYQNPSNINETINKKLNDVDFESDKSYRFLGLCFALICALSISGSIVLNKKLLVLKIPQSILMLHFSILTLIMLIANQIRNHFILHTYSNRSMFTWQFFVAASVSLIQLLSSTITQKAIKLEHPSIVSVVQSSDILFAIILQNLFASVKSNWLVILGSILVTTSIFLVGIHKFWNERKKLSKETNDMNSKM
jgi:drug/metabolite transporter (DMT)-like permease